MNMDPVVNEWLNLVLRWMHLLAGILWIGHLYFFNFVNAHVAKTYDDVTRPKIVPELMPRALYWFRWGAFFTWVSGFLLIGVVYHVGHLMADPGQSVGRAIGVGVLFILFGFFIYDLLWKSPLGKNENAGAIVLFVLLCGLCFLFTRIMSGRAAFIHIGSVLGGTMMMNVWMRIWPAQKKIIRGIKGEQPKPDPSVATFAGLRSKHNVYMSVPLTFFMVSNHFPTVYTSEYAAFYAMGFILFGFAIAKFLFGKAASDATKAA